MAEQQKILVVLQERVRIASAGIETARAKRDKVQGFLQASRGMLVLDMYVSVCAWCE